MTSSAQPTFIVPAAAGVFAGVAGVLTDTRALTVASLALIVGAVAFLFVFRASAVRSGSKIAAAPSSHAGASAVFEAPASIQITEAMTMPASGSVPEEPAVSDAIPPSEPVPVFGSEGPPELNDTAAKPAALRMPASVEPHDVAVALLEACSSAGEVLSAHLWLEDESSATLRLVAAAGTMRPTGDPEPLAGTCVGRALATGVAAFCPEKSLCMPRRDVDVWRYAVPLSSGDARGVAAIDLAESGPDREVLTQAAAALRSALTGALALHVAREQTRAANTMLEATRELSRLVDPEAVVEALLRRAMILSSAQTGSVMLLGDDGRLTIARSAGLPDEIPLVTSVAEGEGIAGWVLATKQPVVVEDLECKGPRSRRHGIRSAVSVPIADNDGILGVLNVGNRTFRARFSSTHRDTLETLGLLGALALRTARALETTQELYFDTLKALAVALETKDPYSRGGTDRVVDLVCAIAEQLGMTDNERTAVRIAALLHDVGMTAAGDVVAVTNRPLSTLEWGMVKVHPVIAADVLEQAPALREAIPIVYHHHERFDGGGYVVGLSAETIPLGARVLAVADAYVAMTSERPYRRARSAEEALTEVRRNAGTQFDPDVVAALERAVNDPMSRVATE